MFPTMYFLAIVTLIGSFYYGHNLIFEGNGVLRMVGIYYAFGGLVGAAVLATIGRIEHLLSNILAVVEHQKKP